MFPHLLGTRLAGLTTCMLLASCGGGNADETPNAYQVNIAIPYAIADVHASGTNPAAYLGTWTSECGEVVIPSKGVKSARNHFFLTRATSTTVSGTFDQWQYLDSQCTQARTILDRPAVEGTVSFKLVETVQLNDARSPIGVNYVGTADKVDATINPSDAPNPQPRYLALQGEHHMRIESTLPLAAMGLTYSLTPLAQTTSMSMPTAPQ
jgi:hypothetical protein